MGNTELGRNDVAFGIANPTPNIHAQYEQYIAENPGLIYDAVIDRVLLEETVKVLQETLRRGTIKGRQGWWNPTVCTLEYLKTMHHDAALREDYPSLLAFTAMLIMRERTNTNAE